MKMDKKARVERALKNLEGIDAAPKIREALAELRTTHAAGRRQAEVDGPTIELDFELPVMLVEKSNGWWVCETTKTDIFAGQREHFATIDRSEKLAIAEMRWRFVQELMRCNFCHEEDAKRYGARAKVTIGARIPYKRIVSK